jgi:hypothetical protein
MRRVSKLQRLEDEVTKLFIERESYRHDASYQQTMTDRECREAAIELLREIGFGRE